MARRVGLSTRSHKAYIATTQKQCQSPICIVRTEPIYQLRRCRKVGEQQQHKANKISFCFPLKVPWSKGDTKGWAMIYEFFTTQFLQKSCMASPMFINWPPITKSDINAYQSMIHGWLWLWSARGWAPTLSAPGSAASSEVFTESPYSVLLA